MTFSRTWLFATVPLFCLGVLAIVRLATGLVRLTRESVVASLPVVPEQSFVLPGADGYSISMQGTLGERGLGDLRFGITAESGGPEVRIDPAYVRSATTSLDGTVRLELFTFAGTSG